MNRKYTQKVILAPLVIAIAIVSGILIGKNYKSGQQPSTFYIYPRTDKLSNVLNYIERGYVDKIDKDKLIEDAIPKILSALDPHSQYIPAKDLQEVNEPLEGNFSGIGVQFNMLNDTLVVLKTIANGPSEKVGILAGDRILIVNKDTVAGKKMPSDSIVGMLKGPRGTEVKVGIQRKNVKKILYFDIIRDNIPLYSMDVAYMIRPTIGYIKLNKFARNTFEEFLEGTSKLMKEGMKSMVLDLRGNGGGYLDAAVNIAEQFLEEGQLIVYTEGHSRPRQEYKAAKGGACQGIKLVVLIDEGSASASEILAGAIQDNDRGLIIGRRSFGKGLVQEQNQFSDGSAIRLTIARYYTPTGRCIQKPYAHGDEENYYMDISNRYKHGEFAVQDSIKFVDSLKFTTPRGKIVYGGGGIMPDIFIPLDTIGLTNYLMEIRNSGLIYSFSLEYADNQRKELSQFANYKDIIGFLNHNNVLDKFIAYVTKNKIPFNSKELNVSKTVLKTQLYAFIIRNILDNDGFYPTIESIDNTLLRAAKELEKYSIVN
jgi:carboxyl-terminal processing protease